MGCFLYNGWAGGGGRVTRHPGRRLSRGSGLKWTASRVASRPPPALNPTSPQISSWRSLAQPGARATVARLTPHRALTGRLGDVSCVLSRCPSKPAVRRRRRCQCSGKLTAPHHRLSPFRPSYTTSAPCVVSPACGGGRTVHGALLSLFSSATANPPAKPLRAWRAARPLPRECRNWVPLHRGTRPRHRSGAHSATLMRASFFATVASPMPRTLVRS